MTLKKDFGNMNLIDFLSDENEKPKLMSSRFNKKTQTNVKNEEKMLA